MLASDVDRVKTNKQTGIRRSRCGLRADLSPWPNGIEALAQVRVVGRCFEDGSAYSSTFVSAVGARLAIPILIGGTVSSVT